MAGGHAGSMVATMSSEEIVVTSPFDGTEIGRVPLSHRRRRRPRRGDGASRRCAPVPCRGGSGPRSSTPPPACSPSARRSSPGRSPPRRPSRSAPPGSRPSAPSARSSSPPPRPARSPARSCRSTRSPPARARSASRCGSRSASSGRSRRSTSRSTSSPTSSPRRSPPVAPWSSSRRRRRRSAPSPSAALLVDECGLPAEYLHVVTGGGSTVGNAIVEHPDIAMITFTGSPEVGWGIRARAPRKRVGLELGNNAPVIIEADSDWKTAASKIRVAGFSHAGQSCISTQRVLVHHDIAEAFTATLVDEVSTLVVGDPLDEATEVSALISTSERDRVKSWIDEAVDQGANVAVRRHGRRRRRARADGAHRRHPGHGGVPQRGVRPGRRRRRLRHARRGDRPRQRHPLRPAGGDLHEPPGRRDEGVRRPRLRRRARQRGADVAGRPAALRRAPRQRQHPRRPRLRRPRDDRDPHGRARSVSSATSLTAR